VLRTVHWTLEPVGVFNALLRVVRSREPGPDPGIVLILLGDADLRTTRHLRHLGSRYRIPPVLHRKELR